METQGLLAGILAVFVNFFLILGTNRLTGSESSLLRAAMAAGIGGLYTGLSATKGLAFLGRVHWLIVMLVLVTVVAYGYKAVQFKKGAVFALLHMALSWLSLGSGGGIWTPLMASAAIFFLCRWSAPGGSQRFIPVQIQYGQQNMKILALRDTGNCLKDPVTGSGVLVIGSKVAQKLTGLTESQLKDPVSAIGALPGLRLIPYQTVGNSKGLLLAMRFKNVQIGSYKGSYLVAFAPEGLEGKQYQAITGGWV